MSPYGPMWARMGPARALEERDKFKKNHFLFDVTDFIKKNILPEHPTCDNRYIMSFGLSFSSAKTIHIQLVRASTLR